MLKDRAIQLKFVKNASQDDVSEVTEVRTIDPEQIAKIAKDQVQHIAIAVGVVIVGTKLLNTVSEIAIITAKSKIH